MGKSNEVRGTNKAAASIYKFNYELCIEKTEKVKKIFTLLVW